MPRTTSLVEQDLMYANLYYQSAMVTVSSEVLLLDFNAILAAVGGSMGLFLGFSFFDFCRFMLNLAFSRLFRPKLETEIEELK